MAKLYYDQDANMSYLDGKTVAVIGYGSQGHAHALNLRDSGVNVIVGLYEGSRSWAKAEADGVTVKSVADAAQAADVVMMLIPDTLQAKVYTESIAPHLKPGDTLMFAHGFNIRFGQIQPPAFVDVSMVAPKAPGHRVRELYVEGAGTPALVAVEQDATGRALDRCIALGIAIGSGYLFPTTFQNEVYSDLTGERGVLMGAIAGIMEAQYEVLRGHGHSPSEAFNETVEEFTESLIRLVSENGMDWMYANCSATAQRGALDWKPKFKKAVMPVFRELYKRVASGAETRRVLQSCGRQDYQAQLTKELNVMANSELWQAGAATRKLRPRESARKNISTAKGVGGRARN